MLHFKTVVTARQQVVESDDIAQYKSATSRQCLIAASIVFPYKTGADQTETKEEQSRAWWQLVGAILILGISASTWLFD